MKLSIAALLLVLVGLFPSTYTTVVGQTQSKEEKIHWNENRKLTWDDFKGIPSGSDEFVASTNSGVSFSFSYKERNGVTTINVTVLSNFYPALSWHKPAHVNDYILAHEQLHFDISELHARKLRMELSTLTEDREYKNKAEIIYNRLEAERRTMQNKYDGDSDHSNDRDNELEWRGYVAEQLEAYERWK